MEGSTQMKTSMTRYQILALGLIAVLILGAGQKVQASGITDGLKATIDQVINVVTDPKYKNDPKGRRDKMKGLIFPKFNFLEMGKRSLGSKSW